MLASILFFFSCNLVLFSIWFGWGEATPLRGQVLALFFRKLCFVSLGINTQCPDVGSVIVNVLSFVSAKLYDTRHPVTYGKVLCRHMCVFEFVT